MNCTSVLLFVIVGLSTTRWQGLRMYIMAAATIPPFIGLLGMSLITTTPETKVRSVTKESVPDPDEHLSVDKVGHVLHGMFIVRLPLCPLTTVQTVPFVLASTFVTSPFQPHR